MTLLFMSHPVAGDVPGNLRRALRWLAYLTATRTESVIAPWIAGLMAGEDDDDPAQRERGLQTCTETARRCDGIILVGGRISSGMRRELDAVRESGGRVIDLTHMGAEPPSVEVEGKAPDPINHPAHYTRSSIETIDAIEAWGLDYHLGNVVKYISRAGHKGDELEDLRKARWYLERAIERHEAEARTNAGLAELRDAEVIRPPRHWLAEHEEGERG